MITIGIYDENKEGSDYLYETINKIMISVSNWQIQIYHSKNEITENIKDNTFVCHLLFMVLNDTNIKTEETYLLIRSICETSPDTDIIFVTDSIKNIYEYSHMHAFAYMLKPVTLEDITNELTRYLKNIHYPMKLLEVTFQRKTHKIPVDSILYIESDLRKLLIHTPKIIYHCYNKLSSMEESLKEDGFIRCHQSYLIPINKITYYTSSKIFIDDTTIPISKAYQDKTAEVLLKHGIMNGKPIKKPASYNQMHTNYGTLVCIEGIYAGAIIRIKPEKQIIIGRNGNSVDIVINLPDVSRVHCSILYHYDTMSYEICDLSRNGTFVNNKRLLSGETYHIPKGSIITFGNNNTIYKLG